MSDSEAPPVSGLVAGKYEVLRLIGRGGMGSVWEGRHNSLGTRVAIKFIDVEVADSKEAQARFVTEARAAATLHSKHAIQIYDHGVTEDGRPYMVMELLTGEPLDKRLDRLGRLSLQETARILGQVSRALQRAHAQGIIHRDLKPENIFLVRAPDEDDEVAKVLDFGIAKIKATPGEQGLSSSTKTGAVLGTPYYMAPEQARGLRTIDTRADLWSLGIIAYKCVTGVLPFEGVSVGDLLVKICTATPPTPSLTVPGLPPAFDSWFQRALGREPDQRFQTASEQADALSLAAGLSVRRPSASSQHDAAHMPASIPSHAPPAAQTPLPAAALTSAPFVTSASSRRASSSRGMFVGVALTALVGGSLGVFLVVKMLAPPRGPSQPPSAAAIVAPPSAPASQIPAVATLAPPASDTPVASASAPPPVRPKPGSRPPPVPSPAPTRTAPSKPAPNNNSDPGY